MTAGSPTVPASDFPTANLPPSATAWGRAVMQRVAQLENQNDRQDTKILDLNHSLVGAMRGGADSDIYTPNGIIVRDFASGSYLWTLLDAQFSTLGDWLTQLTVDQGALDLTSKNNSREGFYKFGPGTGSIVVFPDVDSTNIGVTALDWAVAADNVHPKVTLIGIQDLDPVNGTILEAGVDASGVPYLRIFDHTLHAGWAAGIGGLPTTATEGQFLTWNGAAWVAADLPSSGGGASVLSSYRGDWVPTPVSDGGTTTYFLAPAAVVDFAAGTVPAWIRPTLNGGALSVVPNSDTTLLDTATHTDSLKLVGGTGLSYIEFDVDSTGDAWIEVNWAYQIHAGEQIGMTVNGQNVTSTSTGTDYSDALNDQQVPQSWGYFASAGKHTVRISLDASGAPTTATGTVWVNSIVLHGTTPAGDVAGVSSVTTGGTAPVYTDYAAGDLIRYGGDLWLAEAATDNEASPVDGATWAQLSTHGSSGGSSGEQHDFASAGQWTINHSIGRIPSVTVYDAAGNLLLAEAAATSTQVVITFANPTAGTAVLT